MVTAPWPQSTLPLAVPPRPPAPPPPAPRPPTLMLPVTEDPFQLPTHEPLTMSTSRPATPSAAMMLQPPPPEAPLPSPSGPNPPVASSESAQPTSFFGRIFRLFFDKKKKGPMKVGDRDPQNVVNTDKLGPWSSGRSFKGKMTPKDLMSHGRAGLFEESGSFLCENAQAFGGVGDSLKDSAGADDGRYPASSPCRSSPSPHLYARPRAPRQSSAMDEALAIGGALQRSATGPPALWDGPTGVPFGYSGGHSGGPAIVLLGSGGSGGGAHHSGSRLSIRSGRSGGGGVGGDVDSALSRQDSSGSLLPGQLSPSSCPADYPQDSPGYDRPSHSLFARGRESPVPPIRAHHGSPTAGFANFDRPSAPVPYRRQDSLMQQAGGTYRNQREALSPQASMSGAEAAMAGMQHIGRTSRQQRAPLAPQSSGTYLGGSSGTPLPLVTQASGTYGPGVASPGSGGEAALTGVMFARMDCQQGDGWGSPHAQSPGGGQYSVSGSPTGGQYNSHGSPSAGGGRYSLGAQQMGGQYTSGSPTAGGQYHNSAFNVNLLPTPPYKHSKSQRGRDGSSSRHQAQVPFADSALSRQGQSSDQLPSPALVRQRTAEGWDDAEPLPLHDQALGPQASYCYDGGQAGQLEPTMSRLTVAASDPAETSAARAYRHEYGRDRLEPLPLTSHSLMVASADFQQPRQFGGGMMVMMPPPPPMMMTSSSGSRSRYVSEDGVQWEQQAGMLGGPRHGRRSMLVTEPPEMPLGAAASLPDVGRLTPSKLHFAAVGSPDPEFESDAPPQERRTFGYSTSKMKRFPAANAQAQGPQDSAARKAKTVWLTTAAGLKESSTASQVGTRL